MLDGCDAAILIGDPALLALEDQERAVGAHRRAAANISILATCGSEHTESALGLSGLGGAARGDR